MSSDRISKVALIQFLAGTKDKNANIKNAVKYLEIAKKNNCEIAVLPECFNAPYDAELFPQYAEPVPNGETCKVMSECAKNLKMFIVAGTIPEIADKKLYNTCTVWNPKGELVAKHRKVHLFDVDVAGKITFQESKSFTPGSNFTTFDTGKLKIGVGICHDMRFPELAHFYQQQGCRLIVYPATFCDYLGPPHWNLLLRARAADNQVYVAGAAPARDETASYKSYGHSLFVNPFGVPEAAAEYVEDILYGYVDLDKLEDVREAVPILKQKRSDLYGITFKHN